MTITTTTSRHDLATAVGTADALFAALARIEEEGWDGPTGRAVLDYTRRVVVSRAVRSAGFTGGPEAEYAEATGWAAAWEAMTSRCIRTADSPWGVVTAAVRSAVLNERIEETYGTDARSAWRVHRFKEAQRAEVRNRRNGWTAVADPAALARPLSLSALIDAGYEPASVTGATSTSQWRLPIITDLLVRHGWRRDLADAAVLHVCDHARQNPKGYPKANGWREMSLELGLPPWQARRVTVLLVGTESWPGLMERLDVGGQAALAGPAIEAAVRATVDETMRPPARAALTIDARTARRPALAS